MDAEGQLRLEEEIRAKLDARELDEAAKRALTGYGPEIFGYLVRVMGDEESAEEVYAQFCENLWRGLPRFERKCSFRTWAYHLARNARNQFWKDAYNRLGRRLKTDEANQIQVLARSTTLIFRKTETKDQLAAIRQELDPDERELLVLRVDRRMSWKEIASVLAETQSPLDEELSGNATALRQRFRRLHTKIRGLFAERGLLEPSES